MLIDPDRQSTFARLSGDFNPLHVDSLEARRSQFGMPVVHGVHLVLLALDALDHRRPWRISKLDAQFRRPVLVGERVTCEIDGTGEAARRVLVKAAGQARITVTADLHSDGKAEAVARPDAGAAAHTVESHSWPELASMSGSEPITLDWDLFSAVFPRLAKVASPTDVAVLLGASRVVGMRCPGRWALLRRMTWSMGQQDPTTDDLRFAVTAVDDRLALAVLDMAHQDRHLRVEALNRQPPPAQLTLQAVQQLVTRQEFNDVRALVVGGSRGLGELTSKTVVAGGGEVLLTYHAGAADATAVVSELGSPAQAVHYDVERPSAEARTRIGSFRPTHVLYFATPPILLRPPGTWDPQTYDHFVSVYVDGLSRLLSDIEPLDSVRGVFYPSSTYVDETPPGLAEYAAAKAAGEQLCAAWQQQHPDQNVVVRRFPPLVTDQTAARLGSDTSGNAEHVVSALRDLVNG